MNRRPSKRPPARRRHPLLQPEAALPVLAVVLVVSLILQQTTDATLRWVLLAIVLAANVAAFVTFAWDKFRAQSGGFRVPEKTLLTMTLFGGALGAFIAMRLLRHKTSKASFGRAYWAIVLIQIAALIAVLVW